MEELKKIVEEFDKQVFLNCRPLSHSHISSSDERIIFTDLRNLRPFKQVDGTSHDSFSNISYDPILSLDEQKFKTWIIDRHKKNIMMRFPISEDSDNINIT